MPKPLVSVVIPAYNHAPFVERAIRSVLGQSYAPIELIVVDDGSQDDTWDVIGVVHAATGGAFRKLRKDNGGVSSALNFGIRHTSGEYIALVASDDWFAPRKIERQVAMFATATSRVGLVHSSGFNDFGDGRVVNVHGQYVPAVGCCFEDLLALRVRALAPSVMFPRRVYDEAGGFDESLVAEDLDFYAAITALGYELAYDPEPLVYKTVTGSNLGGRPDLCFPSHFATLEKYRNRLSADRYREIEDALLSEYGRSAAGAGMLKLAWRSYASLAERQRKLRPYVQFTTAWVRHNALRWLPSSVRHALRHARQRVTNG